MGTSEPSGANQVLQCRALDRGYAALVLSKLLIVMPKLFSSSMRKRDVMVSSSSSFTWVLAARSLSGGGEVVRGDGTRGFVLCPRIL